MCYSQNSDLIKDLKMTKVTKNLQQGCTHRWRLNQITCRGIQIILNQIAQTGKWF